MPLPETVRVKISSEAAASMDLTAVVVQEMPLRDLVEKMLGLTGKDPRRVHELLRRGTLVSGASRFRWSGWDAGEAELAALLAAFPESDPRRAFSPERAAHAVLRGSPQQIAISREAGSARRFLHRRSFWDALLDLARASTPAYVEYSFSQRADCFRLELDESAAAHLRESASELNYSALEAQVRRAALHAVDFYVARED